VKANAFTFFVFNSIPGTYKLTIMMLSKQPIIGCTTYRKRVRQRRPIDVYGLMPSYIEAITAAGGIPLLIPLGLSDEDMQAIFDRVDGILLPGGGDVEPKIYNGHKKVVRLWGIDPTRDRTEIYMTRAAVSQSKPIFAICRGIQVMNVALGGTLWEDILSLVPDSIDHDQPDKMPRNHLSHTVTLSEDSGVARSMGKTMSWVNSIHHQAIRDVANELEVTATAPDGIVEAAEVPGHPFAIGVQWHPENLIGDDPAMLGLFKGFVKAATRQPQT
jgi:putative glutamine amidotransferase